MWDINEGKEIQQMQFPSVPNSIQISRDGQLLVLTQGKCVEFYDTTRYVCMPLQQSETNVRF